MFRIGFVIAAPGWGTFSPASDRRFHPVERDPLAFPCNHRGTVHNLMA
jgi:hypothetical protein